MTLIDVGEHFYAGESVPETAEEFKEFLDKAIEAAQQRAGANREDAVVVHHGRVLAVVQYVSADPPHVTTRLEPQVRY